MQLVERALISAQTCKIYFPTFRSLQHLTTPGTDPHVHACEQVEENGTAAPAVSLWSKEAILKQLSNNSFFTLNVCPVHLFSSYSMSPTERAVVRASQEIPNPSILFPSRGPTSLAPCMHLSLGSPCDLIFSSWKCLTPAALIRHEPTITNPAALQGATPFTTCTTEPVSLSAVDKTNKEKQTQAFSIFERSCISSRHGSASVQS